MLLSSNKSGRGFEVGQGSEASGREFRVGGEPEVGESWAGMGCGWEFRVGGEPEVGESWAAGMAGMLAKQKARQ